ncbi:MAG: hypothetical protein ACRYG7_23260 [Janthinobacterium lividum]
MIAVLLQSLFGIAQLVPVTPSPVVITPPTGDTGSLVRLRLTFDKAPTNPAVTIDGMPFGVAKIFSITSDDAAVSSETVLKPVLWGGTLPVMDASNKPMLNADGTAKTRTYPGVVYDDGTGQKIRAGWGDAVCAKSLVEKRDLVYGQYLGLDDLRAAAKTKERAILNHTFEHSNQDPVYQLRANQDAIEKQVGYLMRVLVLPTSYPGLVEPWLNPANAFPSVLVESEGYQPDRSSAAPFQNQISGSFATPDREFMGDGPYPDPGWDKSNWNWGAINPSHELMTRQNFDGQFSQANYPNIKNWIDGGFKWGNDRNVRSRSSYFVHGYDFAAAPWIQQMCDDMLHNPLARGRVAIMNIHQAAEYNECRAKAVVGAPQVSGNTVIVDVNTAAFHKDCRWRNLTFNVTAGGGAKLTGVKVQGSTSYSYNLATGLINSYQMQGEVSPNPVPKAVGGHRTGKNQKATRSSTN